MEEKQGFAYTLKRAVMLVGGNITLLGFAFSFSLPLSIFLVFFEFSLQNSVSLSFHCLYREDECFSENTEALSSGLIQTCLLYFLPYHLLDLFTMNLVLDASSTVLTSEESMGLVHLAWRSIEIGRKRFVGCLITSLFTLLSSLCIFFGLVSATANYYLCVSVAGEYYRSNVQAGLLFYLVLVLFHGSVFVFLTVKFNKWSSGWKMGLVVSVLEDDEEGVYGSRALSLSDF